MSITTIDPATAFVVIDLQQGVAAASTTKPVPEIARRAGELAQVFRDNGLPVVLVNVVGQAPGRTEVNGGDTSAFPDGWTDLLSELGAADSDHTVSKSRWGAFQDTGLYEHLTALGVTQVVVAGVATSIGVESTARAAYDHGFHVTVATDATADLDPEAHDYAVTRIFPRLGETGTVAEIAAAVSRR